MHVFTSVVSNYIPKTRVLAWSLKKHHPEAKFHLVLSDRIPDLFDIESEPFDSIISLNDLPITDLKSWIFKHTVIELCTAVKGFAFQEIMKKYNAEKIFYFDPDIVILSPLDDLLKRLDEHDVLLTPHQIEPDTSVEAIMDNEICCLRHGIYNLGFLAVRASQNGQKFIDWWSERLRLFCYDDVPGGLFTDQRWVDFAPALFEGIDIIKDPGYNVATWNLTHRLASGTLKTGIKINGKPLRFYHFSGFDSGAQEIMLNKYGGKSPILRKLRQWYIEECEKMGQNDLGNSSCIYDYFDNGIKITKKQRLLYRSRPDLQKAFKDPFATANVNRSFFHWYGANAGDDKSNPDNYRLDTVEGLRGVTFELRRELDTIKRSRCWHLAQTIEKVASFCGVVPVKAFETK